jgi:two-component system, NtrC family, response regulator AtoC
MRKSPPESPPARRVLIIEDDQEAGNDLRRLLRREPGLDAEAVSDPELALRRLEDGGFSIVITDLRMPDIDGLEVIRRIQQRRLPVTVIVLTAFGGIDEAVQAIRLGAYDFLSKPIDLSRLRLVLARACRDCALQDDLCRLREELQSRYSFHDVLSRSPKMHAVFELIEQVATTNATVLIEGETGTGKEQIARAIHTASSPQRSGPFMAVSCAAFNENLLESELFGHEKGAYTGATGQRKGRFEQAHGGTLFLDEVGDVPASMQVKLLRVLQERTFERVGGTTPIEVDVRVIAATHQPLEKLIKEGKFREDLYYRLNVMRVELPPLRERPEDVPVLAAFFTERYARPGQKLRISPEAMELLVSHPWPGNVRQLENAVERAVAFSGGRGYIDVGDLPPELEQAEATPLTAPVSLPEEGVDLDAFVADIERELIHRSLERSGGNKGQAAKLLHLKRTTLVEKLKRLDRR